MFQAAGEAFSSLESKIDVSVISDLGVMSAMNGLGDLLESVFRSHAERVAVTGENFHSALQQIVGMDEESAGRIGGTA